MAQQLDKRSSTKAEKGKQTPPAKEKPLEDPVAEKDTKKSTSTRKTKGAGAAKATSSRAEVSVMLNSMLNSMF